MATVKDKETIQTRQQHFLKPLSGYSVESVKQKLRN